MKGKSKSYSFTWRAILLTIKHTPTYFTHSDHVEVFVKKPLRASLPITTTGYRSYFLDPEVLEQNGGPVRFIQAELDRESAGKRWKEHSRKAAQLDFLTLLNTAPKRTRARKRTA